jgi:hypothetical protein
MDLATDWRTVRDRGRADALILTGVCRPEARRFIDEAIGRFFDQPTPDSAAESSRRRYQADGLFEIARAVQAADVAAATDPAGAPAILALARRFSEQALPTTPVELAELRADARDFMAAMS